MKRKIAAILVADASGYAGRLSADRTAAMADLDAARRMFQEIVTAHDGRIFNAAGASILAEFASVVEAVRCALAVQGRHATGALRFRIGLTIGDVVEHEGDLLGDGVNVAARLAGLGPDGCVCVSRGVYEQVRTKVDVSVSDLGLQALKNIPEPVHALSLRAGFDGKVVTFDRPSPSAAPSIPALALAGLAGVALLIVVIVRGVAPPTIAIPVSVALPPPPLASAQPTQVPNASSSSVQFGATKRSQRCSEILERIQSGAASADDRASLASSCQ